MPLELGTCNGSIHEGDTLVRSVQVRSNDKEYIRPIAKVVLILESEEML